MTRLVRTAPLIVVSAMLALCSTAARAQTPAPLIFNVTVVGNTPLHGSDVPIERIPAPVQTATDQDIDRSGALNLADFMNRRLDSVHVNEVQNNPFQPDVNYRGYTASPLLGTPQGLSVYMDGVRLNQPFGDIVSWDLIPRIAISSLALMPGSNPLFGLNTLGGALSLETKNGVRDPGTSVQAIYGSDTRYAVEFEHGGAKAGGAVNWYVAGNFFDEEGWREDSPSQVGQLFGKLGWQRPRTDASLSVGYADTSLNGNGLQETGFLDRDYDSVYTKPDETENRSTFINLSGRHSPRDRVTLSGTAYFRHISTDTLNGDMNEDSLDQALYVPGETAQNTPFPYRRCLENVLLLDEPGEKCNGLLNRIRDPSAQCRRLGSGHLVERSGRQRPPSDDRDGVRRQQGRLRPVHRAGVSQPRSQHHRDRRIRRWRDRRRG